MSEREAIAAVAAKLRGTKPGPAERRPERPITLEGALPSAVGVEAEDRPRDLGTADRIRVVETCTTLLGGLYAHLPQKRAMYGKDPVQRLRLLQQRVDAVDAATFHRTIAEIFTDLRDAHTRYLVPDGKPGRAAVLPFLIEDYDEGGRTHYIVSKTFAGVPEHRAAFEASGFEEGVEVTHWNGVPIARAVDLYAGRETGGRPDARQARALESLTIRPLRYALSPDEDWVLLSFRRLDGREGEVRLEWSEPDLPDEPTAAGVDGPAGLAYAGNPAAEAARRAKKLLFAPSAWYAAETRSLQTVAQSAADNKDKGSWFSGTFQDNLAARVVATRSGEFGLLRLWSFDLRDDDGFIDEVVELLDHLPRHGLIIDLRGNPGGLIWAAERLLQLFTPGRIEPTRFSILATDLTRTMAAAPQGRELAPWRRSLEAAVTNGELYARGLPLTEPRRCNDRGQHYPGPVVAIVDANTYSSGDLFAAGFVDNRVGTLVSVGEATGGGGANVWYPEHVRRSLAGTGYALEDLPAGLSYTIAFRRAMRIGDDAGTSLEDLGVAGHERRSLTRRDLTEKNRDLLDFCGALLASEIVTDLQIVAAEPELVVRTALLDRIDVYVDERPFATRGVDRSAESPETRFELPDGWRSLEVVGLAGDNVRQRRRIGP